MLLSAQGIGVGFVCGKQCVKYRDYKICPFNFQERKILSSRKDKYALRIFLSILLTAIDIYFSRLIVLSVLGLEILDLLYEHNLTDIEVVYYLDLKVEQVSQTVFRVAYIGHIWPVNSIT